MSGKGTLRLADMYSAFEPSLAVYPANVVLDKVPDTVVVPEDHLVLVDAELDYVGILHKDKATALLELLNWACDHYPFQRE